MLVRVFVYVCLTAALLQGPYTVPLGVVHVNVYVHMLLSWHVILCTSHDGNISILVAICTLYVIFNYIMLLISVNKGVYYTFYHNEAIHQRTVLYDNYNTTV